MKTSEPIVLTIFGNERCVASLDDLEAAAHQRVLSKAIKRARYIALVAYLPDHAL